MEYFLKLPYLVLTWASLQQLCGFTGKIVVWFPENILNSVTGQKHLSFRGITFLRACLALQETLPTIFLKLVSKLWVQNEAKYFGIYQPRSQSFDKVPWSILSLPLPTHALSLGVLCFVLFFPILERYSCKGESRHRVKATSVITSMPSCLWVPL